MGWFGNEEVAWFVIAKKFSRREARSYLLSSLLGTVTTLCFPVTVLALLRSIWRCKRGVSRERSRSEPCRSLPNPRTPKDDARSLAHRTLQRLGVLGSDNALAAWVRRVSGRGAEPEVAGNVVLPSRMGGSRATLCATRSSIVRAVVVAVEAAAERVQRHVGWRWW